MDIAIRGVTAVGDSIFVDTGSILPEDINRWNWYLEDKSSREESWIEFENLNLKLELGEQFSEKRIRVDVHTNDGLSYTAVSFRVISQEQLADFKLNYDLRYSTNLIAANLDSLERAWSQLIEAREELAKVQETPKQLQEIRDLEKSIREQTALQQKLAESVDLLARAQEWRQEMELAKAEFAEHMRKERKEWDTFIESEKSDLASKTRIAKNKIAHERALLEHNMREHSEVASRERDSLAEDRKNLDSEILKLKADKDFARREKAIADRESDLVLREVEVEENREEVLRRVLEVSESARKMAGTDRFEVQVWAEKLLRDSELFRRANAKSRVAMDRESRKRVKSEFPDPLMCTACIIPLNTCGCGS